MKLDDMIGATLEAQDGDFVPAVLAEKLVAQVQESDPDALEEWLHVRAPSFVAREISTRLRLHRSRARKQVVLGAFGAAADAAEDGDWEPISRFAVIYEIDEENTRRPFGKMLRADCQFAAAAYERSANEDLLYAAFLKAVAKRLTNNRTVAEVFTEEQIAALERSFLNRAA